MRAFSTPKEILTSAKRRSWPRKVSTSRARLQALADEWFVDYPNLLRCVVGLLKNRPTIFSVDSVTPQEIEEFCLTAVTTRAFEYEDIISQSGLAVAEGKMSANDYWVNAIETFYRVGLVGIKPDAAQPLMWSFTGRRTISTAEIHDDSRIAVHKCFWRVLGVSDRKRSNGNSVAATT